MAIGLWIGLPVIVLAVLFWLIDTPRDDGRRDPWEHWRWWQRVKRWLGG